MGFVGIARLPGLWWFVTQGAPEERIISPSKGLSSPAETFASFHSLWFDRALTRNLLTTLRRLALGFGLAALVGVPLGVLCGCFPRVQAFFLPMTLFGRNIPVAALIPLTFSLFGIGELQKVMFIFIACVAFVVWDTTRAIEEVGSQYIDTAYTLGAGTWQTIGKVLLPLALPSVFNSLRLIFGLAFGYIMLAEVVKFGGETGGLGDLINISQRRGPREHVLLILLIIPVVALVIDRLFFFGAGRAVSVSLRRHGNLEPPRPGRAACLGRPAPGGLEGALRPARAASARLGPTDTAHTMSHTDPEAIAAVERAAGPGDRHRPGARRASVNPAEVREPHVVEFRDVTKTYNPGRSNEFTAIRNVTFVVAGPGRQGRVHLHAGPQRLRQEHDPAADRRPASPASAHQRRGARDGPARERPRRRPRHGLSGLHQLRPSHGARQRRVRPGMPGRAAPRALRACPPLDRPGRSRRRAGPGQVPARALRRHAPAGRDRAHLDPASRGSF